jgi:hypothetical protein
MTATAERIQNEFATLSPEEREELVVKLFQTVQAAQEADWPMAAAESDALRLSLDEAKSDFAAGRGIPHEEIVQEFTPWRKPTK